MLFRTYRSRLIVYALILLAFLVISQIYSYSKAQDAVVAEAERSLQKTAQLFNENLAAERQELERIANVVRDDKRIQEYLFVTVKFDSGYEVLKNLYLKHFGWLPVDRTLILNNEGSIVLGNEHEEITSSIYETRLYNDKMSLYIETERGLELVVTTSFEFKGEVLGTIIFSRLLDQSWLEQKTKNGIGQLIIEKNGIVKYSTLTGYQSKKYQPVDGLIQFNEQIYRIFPISLTGGLDGNTRLWLGASVTDLMERMNQHRTAALSQVILGCFFILFFGWLFSRNFDRPLAQLALLTNEISRGNLPSIEKSQARTEIGMLKNQFVDMVHALREKEKQVKQIHSELETSAITDALTGLFNRRAFESTLDKVVANAKLGKKQHGLCFLDLDQFKIINDSCGHEAGDELLRQLSTLLNGRVRGTDVLARLGGDEFGLVMSDVSESDANKIADDIVRLIKDYKYVWQDKIFSVGVSIGLVMINKESKNVADVMRHADIACYAAKNGGRNRVHVYQAMEEGSTQLVDEINWVQTLNDALSNDRFQLWYQPIARVSEEITMEHGEILLRLIEADGSIISPGVFVPAAERYHLMPEIDKWVFVQTLEYAKIRQRFSMNFMFSMNLSGLTLNDLNILDYFKNVLEKDGFPGQLLCFEITETAAIHNLSNALTFVTTLKQLGCKFALDDFGAGLSTFNHFRNLPVDYIKIDGSFISNIVRNPVDEGMVQSINQIAHLMKKETIAEFVSDQEIYDRVAKLGIDYVQGYAIGKPIPIAEHFANLGIATSSPIDVELRVARRLLGS